LQKGGTIYIIRNILLPTDFSACSAAAFEHASTFAVMYNAHLHVLHVVKEQPLAPAQPILSGVRNIQNSNRTNAEDEVRKFVEKMLPYQSKVIEAVRVGQAYKEIVNYARCEDIDLIVIATHGRTGFTHMVMGSVAERVVRFSPVPVLTIKPQKLSHALGPKVILRQTITEESMSDYSS
jgi:universal stress protein A